MSRYALGIDAGATNMRCALVDDEGNILKQITEHSTGIWNGQVFMDQLLTLARRMLADEVCERKEILGLGIGTCGQVNLNGELFGHNGDPAIKIDPPVPVAETLSKALGFPVKVVNDGQSAIYAESIFGAGKGCSCVVGFTIGTGIGGGVIINGKIWQGAQGIAGHLGFMIDDFMGPYAPCGVPGPVEDYGSGSSIGRIARKRISEDPICGANMLSLTDWNLEKVTAFTVFEAAKKGDALAQEVIEYAGRAIGAAAVTVIHTLNPDVVLLSGGVADQGEMLVAPIREFVENHALYNTRKTPVLIAQLGSRAGVIGAAALVLF